MLLLDIFPSCHLYEKPVWSEVLGLHTRPTKVGLIRIYSLNKPQSVLNRTYWLSEQPQLSSWNMVRPSWTIYMMALICSLFSPLDGGKTGMKDKGEFLNQWGSCFPFQESFPCQPGAAVWGLHEGKTDFDHHRVPVQRLPLDLPAGYSAVLPGHWAFRYVQGCLWSHGVSGIQTVSTQGPGRWRIA